MLKNQILRSSRSRDGLGILYQVQQLSYSNTFEELQTCYSLLSNKRGFMLDACLILPYFFVFFFGQMVPTEALSVI